MRLSVITVSFNVASEVDRTIDSIVAQTYRDIEWVVVDGGSRDGTLERFRAASRAPDILVSEPDRGIADAMNKGVGLATGDAVLFMNAGDSFTAPDSASRLIAGWDWRRFPWAYGDARMRAEDGRPLFRRSEPDTAFASLLGRRCGVPHAAAVALRSLFADLGPFDGAYRLSFDYEFWVRCFAKGALPQHVPVEVADFYLGGASSDIVRREREWRRARAVNGLANPWHVEFRLAMITRCKAVLAPSVRRWRWAYRAKEMLGW